MLLFDFLDPPPRKPGNRKKLTRDQRAEVWNKYIGARKAEGRCYVCDKTIHITEFEAGHNIARAKGGTNNISNFRPICRLCNRRMGTMSIETYKKKLTGPAVKKVMKKRAPAKRKASTRQETDEWRFFYFDGFAN